MKAKRGKTGTHGCFYQRDLNDFTLSKTREGWFQLWILVLWSQGRFLLINLKRSLIPEELLRMFPEHLSRFLTLQTQPPLYLLELGGHLPRVLPSALLILKLAAPWNQLGTAAIPVLGVGLQCNLCMWSVRSFPLALMRSQVWESKSHKLFGCFIFVLRSRC